MEVADAGLASAPGASRTVTREERIVLAVLVLVGLIVRIFAATTFRMVEYDGTYYIRYFEHANWTYVFPPGYPLIIECLRWIVGDGVVAARCASAVWGAILAVPVYFIARKYLTPTLAFAAVLLIEVNPLMIRYGAMALSEMQYVALLLFGLMMYFRGRRLLAGILTGLAFLTRPEALVFFGSLWLYDAVQYRRRADMVRLLLGFLIISLPYAGYVRISTGEWTVSQKMMNIRERGQSIEEILQFESVDYRAPDFAARLESGLRNYPARFAGYGLLILKYAGLAACLLALPRIVSRQTPILCGLTMLAVLPVFAINVADRFIVPYVPFIILLAVITIGLAARRWVIVSGLVLMTASVAPTVSYMIEPDDTGGMEFVEAGTAMRPLTTREDVFVDRKPYVAFYAGGSFCGMPNDSIQAVMDYARRHHATYIVLSERITRLFRPQLAEFVTNDTLLDQLGLVTVYKSGLGTGFGVRIVSTGP